MAVREQFTVIAEKHDFNNGHVLAMLQDIQEQWGYITREALEELAAQLNILLIRLYSLDTFYGDLSLAPRGRNVIRVCDRKASHIRASSMLVIELEKLLGIKTEGLPF